MFKIYGDGFHDDTDGIQQLLDSGKSEIVLDAPEKCYLISRTLKIHGGQTLRIAPTTVIKLAPDSNTAMLEDDSFSTYKENITIDGGIWDMNNTEQEPNPWYFPGKDGKTAYDRLGMVKGKDSFARFTEFPDVYTGKCMLFCRVKNLTIKNLTLRNPVTYGIGLGFVEDFTVSDITFDYKLCNPKYWNMDGVHVEGGCKNGVIRNLKGACHDDLVAITADDGLYGPIANITVDGIFAEHCHSAVRLLSHGLPVKNVSISNVFGSFYTYAVGISKYHGGPEERGVMTNISIHNVSACASEGTEDVPGGKYPLIWIQSGLDIEGLRIENIYREEKTYPTPLFRLEEGTAIKRLRMNNVVQKNLLDTPIPFMEIFGDAEDAIIADCIEI